MTGIRSFLFVIDHLSSGGAQQQMVLLAKELVAGGHAVRFLVYRRHDFHSASLASAGIPVEVVEGGAGRFPVIRRIRHIIRNERPVAILSYLAGPNVYSILGRMAANSKVPLVISERSSPGNPNRRRLHTIAEKLYRFADRIVTNSHHMRRHLQSRSPHLAQRLVTIWNGVDLRRFSETPVPECTGGFRFACIGQIGTFKRPECVIRALARLRDVHGISAQVDWFARRFPDLTPGERSEYERLGSLVAELEVGDLFHWRPETPDIATEIASNHALIHASVVEGLPNAVCEALASGRPVIASDVLDHPQLVRHGQTGYLFEADSPENLAAVLKDFCQLDQLARRQMGINAAIFARESLSAKAMAERYLTLFDSLAGNRH